MPKMATKAADNVFYKARIAAASWNDRLGSREGASEVTGIDRTRLANIELGTINPHPEEVLMLSDTYNAPELQNHFCSHLCPLGIGTISPIELEELERVTLQLISAMKSLPEVKDGIIDIAADGVIDAKEKPRMEQYLEVLDEITNKAQTLKLIYRKQFGKQEVYEELERKAADLAGASERLAALEEQDEQYLAADQEAMKLLQTKNAETARIQSWLGIKESEVVHIRSRAIMLETCGCPVENPECRFLQDAVEAKKKLPTAETELETYRQQAEERAEQLDAEYQAAKKKATNLNCRKDLQAQRFLVADLRKASERFAKLTAQKERLAEVKERIKAIDEELETIPANIEGLEADRFVVEDELKKLRQNAAELASIEAQLSDVKKYIELEKLLPAAEAKKSAAQTRLTELLTYAEKARTAIDGINAEITTLAKAQADVDELKEQYTHKRRPLNFCPECGRQLKKTKKEDET